MSLLRSKPSSAAAIPQYTGLQVQTSSSSVPIQIMWGVNKLAPNIVWTGGFEAVPQYSKKAGKGGGKSLSGYEYRAAFILGLCEGPVYQVEKVWKGQGQTDLGWLGMGLMYGTTPQSPWGYVAAAYPQESLAYNGLVYAAAPAFDLGSGATLPSLSFEVYGQLGLHSGVTLFDADPALVIQDFLLNPQYGVGFPTESVDATTLLGASGGSSFQAYCKATGVAFSPVLSNQETANAILTRWLQLANTAAVWSGGKLKFIPYGDQATSGALTSGEIFAFAPNATAVYSLDDNDFLAAQDGDPVEVSRVDPNELRNWVSLEILQRSNDYDATPVEAWDQNHIESFGLRKAPSITAHEICDVSVAQRCAQLILQRGLYVRNTYAFKLSFEYCLLEPMDIVELNDPGLGLVGAPVRIVSIEEDDEGALSVTAEECPAGTATAVAYPIEGGTARPINRNVVPAPINPPVIFEPPAALTGGAAQIWAAVSGGADGKADSNWGGAIVHVSMDDVAYSEIGEIDGPARQGVLAAALAAPAGANPDTTSVLAADMAMSAGPLGSVSEAQARDGATLCLVGDELVSYAGAALTGADQYSLTWLMRGLYGSAAQPHAAGERFVRLDGQLFKFDLPDAYVGATLNLKFQSFNIFGEQAQDLSTCVAYAYTPRGSGALGPVAKALLVGSSLDYGLASAPANEADDFGLASDPYAIVIDLGAASA
ncbi:phage tail protein [Methylocella sp.]|uniref:phage tail protein n=1 Tax=Methylocella sp. TaxID=1978226 RepID=UPI0035B4242B